MQVAVLGTGRLGAAMALRLAGLGHAVRAWNRTGEKARALAADGVMPASSPAEATRDAAVVHLVLRDDASVNEVLGACGPIAPGTVLVDHTTVLPAGVLARSAQLTAGGVAYLHAPVFMGPPAARTGNGTMFVSGPSPHVDRLRTYLESCTSRVVHLGARPDLAAVFKLVGNALIIALNAGLADALAVAQAAGVPPHEVFALFDTFNPCGSITGRGRAMAAGDYRANFELTMAHKDVGLMLETAAAGGEVLHLLPAIAARMEALIAAGHGARDFNVLAVDTIPSTTG
jgi:3-hydroxyisobutyrate dehydrogenase